MTSKGSQPHSSEHRSEDGPTAFVGLGGECGGPGDVAMAGGVAGVFAFGKDPACALIDFAQSEEIGGDVLLASREAFLSCGKLIHEGETEVVLFGGEVHFGKEAAELTGGLPADLFAEASFVTGSFDRFEHAQEIKEDAGEKMPIFGAAGEQGAEGEFVADGFIDIDDCEIALATGGDVEAQAIFAFGGEDLVEGVEEKPADLVLAVTGL